MDPTQPNRTPKTGTEFLDILKSNNGKAENIAVSDDAILTITGHFPDLININSCSFKKIVIEKYSLELTIGNCDELKFYVNAIK